MKRPLDILILDDSAADAELLVAELQRVGVDFKWRRICSEGDFLVEIRKGPDLVLSDYAMPQFDGLRAARIVQESGLDIPFILVSGTIGEDVAVEAMKLGAMDYLLKDRIARLGSAVERALEQKQIREERRRTQAELVWKTALLEAQVESALDGILVVDAQAKRILQNRRLIEIFKIPAHIADGDDDRQLLSHVLNQMKNPEEGEQRIRELYENPEWVGEDEIELADGTVLDRYSAPVRDRADNYYGRIWTFRDITDRRRLEQQLRQSQKMEAIGMLAGGVAHDFNNLLSVIQGNCSLLEIADLDQEKYLAEIQLAVERAASLTRQLLTFSRRQPIQLGEVDLNEVVGKIARMLQRILGEDITLQFQYSAEPLFLNADAGMLDQVLLNLAVNSRDAMPRGGRLTVQTSKWEASMEKKGTGRPDEGCFAMLRVTDTGCGIPPEIVTRIFEPFFTTKDTGRGTGLGLATVHGIVQQHQGWIEVASEVGKGTTFTVFLPLIQASVLAGAPKEGVRVSPVGGTEAILVVEDEATLRRLFHNILSRLGYRIYEAATGVGALEVWHEHKNEIELVLTDMVMPDGMTGGELARTLLGQNPDLPVIFISGYSPEIIGGHTDLQEGVNFLSKPFQMDKLAQIVRRRLDTTRRAAVKV